MYKVLIDSAKIPVIAGKNQKKYHIFHKNSEIECQDASLQKEFDKLITEKVLEKIEAKQQKQVVEKEKKEPIVK